MLVAKRSDKIHSGRKLICIFGRRLGCNIDETVFRDLWISLSVFLHPTYSGKKKNSLKPPSVTLFQKVVSQRQSRSTSSELMVRRYVFQTPGFLVDVVPHVSHSQGVDQTRDRTRVSQFSRDVRTQYVSTCCY